MNKTLNTLVWPILATPLAYLALIWDQLPDQVAGHHSFAGLRLPWTLKNEDNWRKTHLLAGKLFFGGGLLIAVICLFTPVIFSIIAFFTICTIIVLIPCIYSYRLYKQQQ